MDRFAHRLAMEAGSDQGRTADRSGDRGSRWGSAAAAARWLALAGLLVAGSVSNATIIGVEFGGNVYSIDETTAVATLLSANSPTFSPNSMAKNSAGVLYTAGGLGAATLDTVNPTTGVITVGPMISLGAAVSIRGMAFSSTDVLYAVNNPIPLGIAPPFQLYTINTSTGVGTLVGNVGLVQGLAFSPSGTLYGFDLSNPPNEPGLVIIDPATGATTDVNPAIGGNASQVQAIAFSPAGVLYGARSSLYTINLTTGALTLIGSMAPANDIRGMEFPSALPPAPAVSLTPAALAFGSQLIGATTAAQALTLQNIGTATLNIASIAASGDFAQTNTCGATLAPSATCTINVTFTPTALGVRSGALSVASNAAGSPHTSALSGTGVAAPPPGVPTEIPTLSQWGLIVLSLLVGMLALGNRRPSPRRR